MHIDDTKEINICVLAISSVFFQKRKRTQSFLFQKKNSICTLKNKKSTQSPLLKKKKKKKNSICTFQNEKKYSIVLFKTKNLLRRTSGSLRSCPPNTLFSLSGNVHGVLVLVTPFLFLTFFSSPLLRVHSFSSIEKEFGQNAHHSVFIALKLC